MIEQDFRDHVLRVKLDGYTILPDLLTGEECDESRQQLDRLSEEAECQPGASVGGVNNLFNKARVFERIFTGAALFFGRGCCVEWCLR